MAGFFIIMEKRIAIQGFEGSFHQEAANHFFGDNVKVLPCATFRETVRQASDKKVSYGGVIAIENSTAGSILPNYNLLQKSSLHVIRSEEHTSELQSLRHLVCRLLLE